MITQTNSPSVFHLRLTDPLRSGELSLTQILVTIENLPDRLYWTYTGHEFRERDVPEGPWGKPTRVVLQMYPWLRTAIEYGIRMEIINHIMLLEMRPPSAPTMNLGDDLKGILDE
jgi:hypothetical protein